MSGVVVDVESDEVGAEDTAQDLGAVRQRAVPVVVVVVVVVVVAAAAAAAAVAAVVVVVVAHISEVANGVCMNQPMPRPGLRSRRYLLSDKEFAEA